MSKKLKPEPKLSVAKRQPPKWQRERNITLIIWVIFSLAIVLALGLVGYWGYDNYVAAWHKPVVKVNDTVLDMSYYVKMLRYYSEGLGEQFDETRVPYQLLYDMESNELAKQGTPELGIQVSEEEITEKIKSLFIPPDEDGGNTTGNSTEPDIDIDVLYQNWLNRIRFSDSEYREVIRVDILRGKLAEYLKEEKVPLETEHVHLHAIVVDTGEKANETIERLNNGEDFASLAEELSIDEASQQLGGDLGWVPRGIMLPELDEVAFNLDIGNVSEPIISSKGYYIIKVSEKDENMKVNDEYIEILAQKELGNWYEEQRESATIVEYLDDAKISWALSKIK